MEHITTPEVIIALLVVLVAITLHEAGHAYAAKWLGDDTAHVLGRTSLKPWRHIDPLGTIILPLLLIVSGLPAFGWAKAVPVQVNRLRNPRWGYLLVAIAGPLMNLAQLLLAALILWFGRMTGMIDDTASALNYTLALVILLNAILIFFNMLPLPPLDGSRVLAAIFPPLAEPFHMLERGGVFLVLALFMLFPRLSDGRIDPGNWLVFTPAAEVMHWIDILTTPEDPINSLSIPNPPSVPERGPTPDPTQMDDVDTPEEPIDEPLIRRE